MTESADERKGQEFLSVEFLTLHHLPQQRRWFPSVFSEALEQKGGAFLPPFPLNICMALIIRVFPQTPNTTHTGTLGRHMVSQSQRVECYILTVSPKSLHVHRSGLVILENIAYFLLASTLQQNKAYRKELKVPMIIHYKTVSVSLRICLFPVHRNV